MAYWRINTETEKLAKERSRFRRTILLMIMVAAVVALFTWVSRADHGDNSRDELAQVFPGFDQCVVAVGAVLLLVCCYQLVRPAPLRQNVKICARCNRVKSDDGQRKCGCGGEYYGMNQMTWEENPTSGPRLDLQHNSLEADNRVHADGPAAWSPLNLTRGKNEITEESYR